MATLRRRNERRKQRVHAGERLSCIAKHFGRERTEALCKVIANEVMGELKLAQTKPRAKASGKVKAKASEKIVMS